MEVSRSSTFGRHRSTTGAHPRTATRVTGTSPVRETSRSRPSSPAARSDEVRALVGLPAPSEVVAYCHVGTRSAFAVQVLRDAGYEARNYAGSWHEWSRDLTLPVES